MPFDAQIAELSNDQLEQFFSTEPTTTPSADALKVGKDVPVVEQDAPQQGTNFTQQGGGIPMVDDDFLNSLDTPTDDKTTEEPIVVEDKTKTEDPTPTPVAETKQPTEQINEVLKNTVDYLITNGQWVDFDGREDLEITQEVYAELATQQNQRNALEIANELIDSTGVYGKAIISHIKSGGNPDEIIDLFKEQKQLEAIDTSTEQGKQLKIEKYYKDVLGWKQEKVAKQVNRLIEDNEIDAEFSDVEELYDQHYKRSLDQIQAETKEKEQKKITQQKAFVQSIKTTLDEDTTLTDKEKRLIAGGILEFRHSVGEGQKVNDFYLKFAEMQNDPKQYIKLARFVMDPEGYEKSLKTKAETKAAKETFTFIKNNAAVNGVKAAEIQKTTATQQYKGTNFSYTGKK